MKFYNCTLNTACKIMKNSRLILFGKGSWLKTINYSELMELKDNFAYVIDNNPGGTVDMGGKILNVYSPSVLMNEKDCKIILTSPVYMYDMFCQLESMSVDDSLECYSFPFMQMISLLPVDQNLLQHIIEKKEQKIPKTIHSFWFSGEEKPESYKRCVDTWYSKLGGYEIVEWNQCNYKSDNPFFKKAIECGAWAFASDYARLDVLEKYGGIYLDMDVEVYKTFDSFLGNEAILSFSNNIQIDLAVMGSMPYNPLIRELREVYEDVEIPNKREEFSKFFQPVLVKPILVKNGVKMNGSLQEISNATIFPSAFFMPQEHIVFRPFKKSEWTVCNHLDNFGWSFNESNKREKKIRDNRLLWEKIDKTIV